MTRLRCYLQHPITALFLCAHINKFAGRNKAVKRVPLSLKIFLTALAIVDDIGGIIVIALFYSGHIAVSPLLISVVLLGGLYLGGRFHINNALFYYVGGFIVWLLFLESGIHPSIAGVMVAFTVPARPKIKLDEFAGEMKENLALLDFSQVKHSRRSSMLNSSQALLLSNIHRISSNTVSPLFRRSMC